MPGELCSDSAGIVGEYDTEINRVKEKAARTFRWYLPFKPSCAKHYGARYRAERGVTLLSALRSVGSAGWGIGMGGIAFCSWCYLAECPKTQGCQDKDILTSLYAAWMPLTDDPESCHSPAILLSNTLPKALLPIPMPQPALPTPPPISHFYGKLSCTFPRNIVKYISV